MTQQTINVGTVAGDNTGDPGRTAFQKINSNFSELYNGIGGSVLLSGVAGTNTITATSTTYSAYFSGSTVAFVAAGANTGATTLNINGLGAKAITKQGTTALVSGDIVAGEIVYATYDGTRFQLITPAMNFVASGSNPVARTIQSKLRDIKAASDYSTFSDYSSNALSGGFFTQNGAVIQRLTDRVMIGGAALNDCAFPNVYQDWLTVFQIATGLSAGSIASAQSAVLNSGSTSETAGGGFVAGIQSLNFASVSTNAISSTHIVVNNNATYATNGWALYAEAHKTTSASGNVYACELDTRTLAATTTPTPFQQGSVVGIQIASGAGVSATGQFDASAAIQIQNNPKSFKVGINFGASSIVGTDGSTGTGIAIAMAKGHLIQWYNSSQQVVGAIYSTCAATANHTKINFTDNGLQINSSTSAAISYFSAATSAVNWLSFYANSTGNAPTISAAGSDTNVDLTLSCQGTGVVRYGTYTAGVVAQAGYITIKDSGGTTRRLLVG